jgi:hypothetical protein
MTDRVAVITDIHAAIEAASHALPPDRGGGAARAHRLRQRRQACGRSARSQVVPSGRPTCESRDARGERGGGSPA